MNRVGTGALSRLEQSLDREIALARRGRTDRHREIGGADVRRGPVGCGVDGDRLETFFMTRADDAKSDFAAIGDQHPLHGAQAAGGVVPEEEEETAAEEEIVRGGAVVHLAHVVDPGRLVPARCLDQLAHGERPGGGARRPAHPHQPEWHPGQRRRGGAVGTGGETEPPARSHGRQRALHRQRGIHAHRLGQRSR